MLSYLFIAVASFTTSVLTMYSGFGLGTILLPVFSLFFPVQTAVAVTAVVHGTNNVMKTIMVGKHADKGIVLRFGLPAVIAAFFGAGVLAYTTRLEPLYRYSIGSHHASITLVKLLLAFLMLFFALFELLPSFRSLKFDKKYLGVGGILSGFFGGFSGHQGALRSAFLAKMELTSHAFVGTNAVIGLMIDMIRIGTYVITFRMTESNGGGMWQQWPLIGTAIVWALLGVIFGAYFLKKVTMEAIQTITGVLLFGIAVGLGTGVI